MDIIIGKYSFRLKTLKTITKKKALESFGNIDRKIVEKAWNEANPRKRNKSK
jgi:hypothetical protein